MELGIVPAIKIHRKDPISPTCFYIKRRSNLYPSTINKEFCLAVVRKHICLQHFCHFLW